MCGRFVSASPPDQIASYFDAEEPEAVLPPSFNVAPTKDVYAVLSDGGVRPVYAFHWGLIPLWAQDAKIVSRLGNSRPDRKRVSQGTREHVCVDLVGCRNINKK